MDSISENSGRTTRNGVYCSVQDPLLSFTLQKDCTWRPHCVSIFYSGLCNQRVRRVLVYLTVSFHPLSPSSVPSFIPWIFSPCLSLHLYDNSEVPIVLTASLWTRKFIKLFAEMQILGENWEQESVPLISGVNRVSPLLCLLFVLHQAVGQPCIIAITSWIYYQSMTLFITTALVDHFDLWAEFCLYFHHLSPWLNFWITVSVY